MNGDKVGYVANSLDTACDLSSKASDLNIGDDVQAEYLMHYIFRFHIARLKR